MKPQSGHDTSQRKEDLLETYIRVGLAVRLRGRRVRSLEIFTAVAEISPVAQFEFKIDRIWAARVASVQKVHLSIKLLSPVFSRTGRRKLAQRWLAFIRHFASGV